MKIQITAFMFISILFFTGCSNIDRPLAEASPTIRILLFEGDEVTIDTKDSFLFLLGNHRELGEGPITIAYATNGFTVNGVPLLENDFEISPTESFEYDGTLYRGTARIVNTGKYIQLINVIDMESYLYGVVPGEIPASWDYEALKAQAIVARTYALYEITSLRSADKDYDLYDDTRSQVYTGLSGENKFTSVAVDSTMGEIIYYNDEIIKSYFHACTGGMSASAESVFGEERPYLVSVESPTGLENEDYTWETFITFEELKEKLDGRLDGNIESINVTSRDESQRIETIEIKDDTDDSLVLDGTELRALIGYSVMKSTRANIIVQNDYLLMFGVGYGHGVGMGQWDAHAMALEGSDYEDIIAYFYPGTEIREIW